MPMGKPIMPPWANNHNDAYLQAKTVPKNLILSELAQWLLSSNVCKIPEAFISDSRSPYYAHGHAHDTTIGKLLWRCTSIGQDGCNELDLDWIGPMVTELRHLQKFCRTKGQRDGRRACHSPLFPSERVWDNKVISEVIPGIQLFLPTTWKAHHSPWLYFRPYRT